MGWRAHPRIGSEEFKAGNSIGNPKRIIRFSDRLQLLFRRWCLNCDSGRNLVSTKSIAKSSAILDGIQKAVKSHETTGYFTPAATPKDSVIGSSRSLKFSLVDRDECWISNGVRGLIRGKAKL